MPSSPTSVSSKLPKLNYLYSTFGSINSWISKKVLNTLNIINNVIKCAHLISKVGEGLGNSIQFTIIFTYITIVIVIFFKFSFEESFSNPIFI